MYFNASIEVVTVYVYCLCVYGCTLYTCLHEADLGEALLVDMVHHHNFIVITGW